MEPRFVYDSTTNDSQSETLQPIIRRLKSHNFKLHFWHFRVKTLFMKQILSIQSAVTLGFVGNSVAAPVLTTMGHHPLAVDTIALAAHPGYGQRSGGAPTDDSFTNVLRALSLFDALANIDFVITGYLGSAHQAGPIHETISAWREQISDGIYILDPVLGDSDSLYVKPQIAESLQAKLLPLANIITPNRFELGFLATSKVTDLDAAIAAGQKLLTTHPRLCAVFATGICRKSGTLDDIGDLLITENDAPLWLPARCCKTSPSRNIPGGGDLLTAVMTGYLANGMDLVQAAGNASQMAQRIIANSAGTRDLSLMQHLHLLQN